MISLSGKSAGPLTTGALALLPPVTAVRGREHGAEFLLPFRALPKTLNPKRVTTAAGGKRDAAPGAGRPGGGLHTGTLREHVRSARLACEELERKCWRGGLGAGWGRVGGGSRGGGGVQELFPRAAAHQASGPDDNARAVPGRHADVGRGVADAQLVPCAVRRRHRHPRDRAH